MSPAVDAATVSPAVEAITRYVAPRTGLLAEMKPPRMPAPVARSLAPASAWLAGVMERQSETARRRARFSLLLATLLNVVGLTLLGAFGVVRIWIPMTPGDSLTVVLVDLPVAPIPALRDIETTPVPEPEPVKTLEPEPVEEPEIKPEPEPEPAKEEPEVKPPAEEEPVLKLAPEPIFAPPSEDEQGLLTPAPEEAPGDQSPIVEAAPTLDVGPRPDPQAGEQTPADSEAPLIDPGPDLEAQRRAREEAEKRRLAEAEALRAAPPVEEAPAEEATGDDAFDEEPVLDRKSRLPAVDLPAGALASAPGTSGVVAIFCPKEFQDKDKAAECAGRTEIKSGWRPGASGEDWSDAVQLLKGARARGETGDDPALRFGPDVARRLDQERKLKGLTDERLGLEPGNVSPAEAASSNIDRQLNRPAFGDASVQPSWTLPTDPNVSQKDLRRLEQDLEDAERRKNDAGESEDD